MMPLRSVRSRPIVITGGAGFIGSNLADRLLRTGKHVLVLDDVSRPSAGANLEWLRGRHGSRLQVKVADVRDEAAVQEALARAAAIFHLAARNVAVAGREPDYADVNAGGTRVVLEAIRRAASSAPLVYASSSDVYGALDDLELTELETRCEPAVRMPGLAEDRAVSPSSPLAHSIAQADRTVVDYAREFGVRAVVFRIGTVYGPRQSGDEHEGWVARYLVRALEGQPLAIRGSGKELRDLLFIDDLVDALLLAQRDVGSVAGRVFNIGGGAANAASRLELVDLLALVHGSRPRVSFETAPSGEPRWFVSDLRAFRSATGWTPRVGVREGLQRLNHWLVAARGLGLAPGMKAHAS
ncbi:MAG: SDR family NAD(P)-dependent oxidoreductase [Deltaproteobacteria bacterium]|nr:SDR family NAD(P)-dependent oxidoreductase [Deltaproteobacteria bacterium]